MKIGTLSLNINTDDLNYGAMLHSWAFQQVLRKNDIVENTEIIDYTTDMLADFNRNYPVVSYLKKKRLKSAVKLMLSGSSYKKRLSKFEEFIRNNMDISAESYDRKKLSKCTLPYDCLICESDVIWSPKFFGDNLDPAFFLKFSSAKNLKKIIYSASMANADFNDDTLSKLKKYSRVPDHISCREEFAVKFLKENTGIDAKHVLDPVMLLKAEDYFPICSKRLIDEPYLLLYIPLGYNSDYQKTALKYAEENNLRVVELSYFTWNNYSHTVIADAGIEDFISLIRYADTVFTNSFHAVCFSLLFNVNFYAFYRKTGRKTEDFCKWIGISERYLDINDFSPAEPLDYQQINAVINDKRTESLDWLNNAIKS